MSTTKTTYTSKPEPKSPNFLTKEGKTTVVELTEEELERAKGGNRPIIVVC